MCVLSVSCNIFDGNQDMDSKSLTTKEVARLCRVSDATVKRWEIDGLIKSERTNGGHRRFRAEEVARFQQEQHLGEKRCPGDESAVTVKTRRHLDKSLSDCSFFQALIVGCEDEAANLLIKEYLNGQDLTEIFDGLISSTMKHIGELWYQGKLSVAQEHLATRTVLAALHKLRNSMKISRSNNKLAVCCAFEGDFHELPTHLAQLTFESEGWEVLNFGANTPLFSLATEVLVHKPHIVCLSSTVMDNLERTSRDYKDFCEKVCKTKTKIIIGGQTFTDKNLRSRFPADLYPQSFADVAEFIR